MEDTLNTLINWISAIGIMAGVTTFIIVWAAMNSAVEQKIRKISNDLHEREVERLRDLMSDTLMTIYEENRFKSNK